MIHLHDGRPQMIANLKDKVNQTSKSMQWERREAKYIIPEDIIPDFRRFIAPFVMPDPNGQGEYPEYAVTTIQLDAPDLTLHYAKAEERLNRFKLRIRTYGFDFGTADAYLEIKRKLDTTIVKTRSTIDKKYWTKELMLGPNYEVDFKNDKEKSGFYEFIRLQQAINAVPKVIIRYDRESYFGTNEEYARITLDRRIRYRPLNDYDLFPQGGNWWPVDTQASFGRSFAGVILELKSYNEVPVWMVEAVRHFDLIQTGFCKYSAAMDLEARFTGMSYTDAEEGAWY